MCSARLQAMPFWSSSPVGIASPASGECLSVAWACRGTAKFPGGTCLAPALPHFVNRDTMGPAVVSGQRQSMSQAGRTSGGWKGAA